MRDDLGGCDAFPEVASSDWAEGAELWDGLVVGVDEQALLCCSEAEAELVGCGEVLFEEIAGERRVPVCGVAVWSCAEDDAGVGVRDVVVVV